MKRTLSICRFLASVVATSCALSACERHQAPPPPSIHMSEGPDRSSQTSQTDVPKLPYGAAAPMAPGTDGLRPPVAMVEGIASDAQAASSPENVTNSMPTGAGPTAASVPLSATELTFITQAIDAGLFDLRVGQLGTDRANDSLVKSYAALLVTDQVALNNGLQQLARQLNVPVQNSLSEPKQRVLDSLARTSALEFDRQLMGAVGIQAQQATTELFERTGRETRNPLVQAFVLANLPTLRARLTTAQRLPIKG